MKTSHPGSRLVLSWILLALGGLSPGARGAPGEGTEEDLRPYDHLVLKNGNTIEGTIETPGDPSTLPELLVVTSSGATRLRLKRNEIESILPRQTADEVYRRKKKRVALVTRPAERARAELEVGLWCKRPALELDGAAPQPTKALEHLLNAAELDSSLAEVYPQLLTTLDSLPADPNLEARVLQLAESGGWKTPELDFRLGSRLAEAGLSAPARERLERFLTAGGSNAGQERRAREILRDIFLQSGNPTAAIQMYEKLLAAAPSGPGSFEAHYELSRILALGRAPDVLRSAREHLTQALKVQPDYLQGVAELAALDYRLGAFPAAEKGLRDLLAKDAGNVAVSISLAQILLRTGKLEPAEEALRPLLSSAKGEDLARAHQTQGLLREIKGDDLGANASYREALALDPGLLEARVGLALILLRAGQGQDAEALARELLPFAAENVPTLAAAERLLAECAAARGNDAEALTHLERALEVDSGDPLLLERAGILSLRAGKLDPGYALLLRARQAAGERPELLNALAYYHYTRGDLDQAKSHFDAVLKLVPAPPRPSGRDAKALPLPPARLYALRGKELIEDLGRLEMWAADLGGPDVATLDGWEETERFGVEVVRRGGLIVLGGKQSAQADGVTMALLDRPVDVSTFERVAASLKLESGKARVGLRLEGFAKTGGSSTGIVVARDFDGTVRIQVKTSSGDWEALPRTEDVPPEGGKLVNPERTVWPNDRAFHTLEIRRSGRPAAGAAAAARPTGVFDVYLDGQSVALNVKVTGIGGKTYSVGVSGQTDAIGNEYSIVLESFKVYRERPVRRSQIAR